MSEHDPGDPGSPDLPGDDDLPSGGLATAEPGGPAGADAPASSRRRRRSGLRALIVLALVAGAIGFLALRGLGDATTYFYNVDEAVEQRSSLGDDRFRMQGTVLDDVEEPGTGEVAFTVTYDGVTADVVHAGDPPELFQPGIPVVIEGSWDGETFRSDRIVVKHSSEYEAENPDRLSEADDEGAEDVGEGSGDPSGAGPATP